MRNLLKSHFCAKGDIRDVQRVKRQVTQVFQPNTRLMQRTQYCTLLQFWLFISCNENQSRRSQWTTICSYVQCLVIVKRGVFFHYCEVAQLNAAENANQHFCSFGLLMTAFTWIRRTKANMCTCRVLISSILFIHTFCVQECIHFCSTTTKLMPVKSCYDIPEISAVLFSRKKKSGLVYMVDGLL